MKKPLSIFMILIVLLSFFSMLITFNVPAVSGVILEDAWADGFESSPDPFDPWDLAQNVQVNTTYPHSGVNSAESTGAWSYLDLYLNYSKTTVRVVFWLRLEDVSTTSVDKDFFWIFDYWAQGQIILQFDANGTQYFKLRAYDELGGYNVLSSGSQFFQAGQWYKIQVWCDCDPYTNGEIEIKVNDVVWCSASGINWDALGYYDPYMNNMMETQLFNPSDHDYKTLFDEYDVTWVYSPSLSASISHDLDTIGDQMYQYRNITFLCNPYGGTSPYSFQWYSAGSPVSGATGILWESNRTAAGDFAIFCRVTDQVPNSDDSNTITIHVYSASPPVAGEYFFEDFEHWNMNNWTVANSSATVWVPNTEAARYGTYGCKISPAGSGEGHITWDFPVVYNTVWMGLFWKTSSDAATGQAAVAPLSLMIGSEYQVSVLLSNYWGDGTVDNYGINMDLDGDNSKEKTMVNETLISDVWHYIVLGWHGGDGDGWAQLWLNGVLKLNITGADNDFVAPYASRVRFLKHISKDQYFDEIRLATSYFMFSSSSYVTTVSADLEDVDDDGADWVFTNWKYYQFTVNLNYSHLSTSLSFSNVSMSFTIPTSFEDVACGFWSDGSDWIYSSNMSYQSPYGEPVNFKAGSWNSGSTLTTVTFDIYFQGHVLDVWLPEDAIPVYVQVNASDWEEGSSGLFRIYSKGGFTLNTASSNSTYAWILPGGTPFSFHVEDDGSTQSMYNEIWFRDVQHMKLLPEIHFSSCTGNQFELRYGVDYSFGDGEWNIGWYWDIVPISVHYNGLFTQAVWINMTVRFCNRSGTVSQEDLYMFNHGSITGPGKPGWWEMWIDLWVSDKNASSVGAGRINAYEYAMEDQAALWLRWLANSWAPMDDVFKEWSGEIPILASDNSTKMSAERVVMWRYWSRVRVFTTGSGQEIEIRNFESFDETKSQQLPLTGISTPVFDETIVPVVGSKTLFGALFSMFSLIGAILQFGIYAGALVMWDIFVDFLDRIAAMFGQPQFFSNLFAFIGLMFNYLLDSLSWIPNILMAFFLLFTNLLGAFLDQLSDLISAFIVQLQYFWAMMEGAYGVGVNVWDALGINQWIMIAMILYPIYLIILWDEEGLDPVLKQLGWLFGILGWIANFLLSVAKFIISIIVAVIEAIPVAE